MEGLGLDLSGNKIDLAGLEGLGHGRLCLGSCQNERDTINTVRMRVGSKQQGAKESAREAAVFAAAADAAAARAASGAKAPPIEASARAQAFAVLSARVQ